MISIWKELYPESRDQTRVDQTPGNRITSRCATQQLCHLLDCLLDNELWRFISLFHFLEARAFIFRQYWQD